MKDRVVHHGIVMRNLVNRIPDSDKPECTLCNVLFEENVKMKRMLAQLTVRLRQLQLDLELRISHEADPPKTFPECSLCRSNEQNCILDCGHPICSDCCKKIGKTCPWCRHPIKEARTIRH